MERKSRGYSGVMKTSLMLVAACLIMFQPTWAQAAWVDLSANLPESAYLNDMHFIGEQGWLTGGNKKVYYTKNGGRTFTVQDLPTDTSVEIDISQSIFMLSAVEGYVVTNAGYIYHTKDGGSNWKEIGSTGAALWSVHFPPAGLKGYACGSDGKIYSISGTTVALDAAISGDAFTSLIFPATAGEGWIISGPHMYHRTTNWLDDQNYDNTNYYTSLCFTDSKNGWAVGAQGKIIHTGNGKDWVPQTGPSTENLTDVFFLNSLEGWAVGDNVILHTADGGATWDNEAQSLTSGESLMTVYAVDGSTAYVAGNDTFLKYSLAAGTTDTAGATVSTAPTLGTLMPSTLTSAPASAQTFTATYSDADGYADIKQAYLRVHTAANGIYLRYDRTTNKLYLYNDAGTATVGSCTPGVAGTLTNAQGSLNCAATTVAVSGNNLTINWNITPSAAFVSATKKNLYMKVSDMSNLTAGWTDKGDWTIKATNVAPTLGTLTPSVLTSAPEAAQTFTAIYSDADGYANIKQAYLRVHTAANGIYLRYDRTTNKLYLYNDAGTATVGSCTPGVAGTLTNTQGSLNCAATTVAVSGNNLTINWNITPSAAFASATKKNLYMKVSDMSNLTAGWTDKGDWTIKATNVAPTLGTLTPSVLTSAPEAAQTFTAIYSDADGYANIKQAYLRVHTAANGIYLRYDRTTNKLYLYNDAGTATVGSCTPGVAGTLTNTQGSLNCAATTVAVSGNNLTINWNITPSAAFASATARNLYMFVSDMSNLTAGWTDKGDWTIKATNVAPTLGALTPSVLTSTPAMAQTFTAIYSDADGYANLKTAELLVGPTTGISAIWAKYDRTTNKLYLYNDAGTATVGSCTPGDCGDIDKHTG